MDYLLLALVIHFNPAPNQPTAPQKSIPAKTQNLMSTSSVVMSAAENLEPEGLTAAEENAERLEIQTAKSPSDSPPPVDRLRARLWGRLMTKRSEDHLKAAHRNIRSTSPEY